MSRRAGQRARFCVMPLAVLLGACPARPSASVTPRGQGVEVVCHRGGVDVRLTFAVPGMPDTTAGLFNVRAGDVADLQALRARGTYAMIPGAGAPWVGYVHGWSMARGTAAFFYGGGHVIVGCDDPGTSWLGITAPLTAWTLGRARP